MALNRTSTILFVTTFVAATSAMPTTVGLATTVVPMDLRSCVRLAGVAFAGTVSKTWAERLPSTIVTHVHFTEVRYAKGARRGSEIQLTLEGGSAGGMRLFSIGQPTFEVGRRYVVLSTQDLGSRNNSYLPIVGLYQGFFQIGKEDPTGPAIVLDWDSRPVVRIEGDQLVVTAQGSKTGRASLAKVLSTSSDPGERMAEARFLVEISRLAAK